MKDIHNIRALWPVCGPEEARCIQILLQQKHVRPFPITYHHSSSLDHTAVADGAFVSHSLVFCARNVVCLPINYAMDVKRM